MIVGPIPGRWPGRPDARSVAETYPWFTAPEELAGFVEEEYYLEADGWRTRILVRRPLTGFSGVVVMEWLNVSNDHDADVLWQPAGFARSGHCWIGVSAQALGVRALREWSPARYGRLDPRGDGLAGEVFAAAGAAVRAGGLGFTPAIVLAAGASQSAGWIALSYDSTAIPRVFDGYLCAIGPAPSSEGPEPVLQILAETDVPAWWPGGGDRPDTDRFRRWEVTGTSHADWYVWSRLQRLRERELGEPSNADPTAPRFSRVPLHQVIAQGIDHLAAWARGGLPPPTAAPIQLDRAGRKARDDLGLARGGIRLSAVEAPIALNSGDNPGSGFAGLSGTYRPFTPAELTGLYPSKLAYLLRVARADHRAVKAGYLHPADAQLNLRAAYRWVTDFGPWNA